MAFACEYDDARPFTALIQRVVHTFSAGGARPPRRGRRRRHNGSREAGAPTAAAAKPPPLLSLLSPSAPSSLSLSMGVDGSGGAVPSRQR